MKIVLLTTHMNMGGISVYTFNLAKELKRRRHKVTVASAEGELVPYLKKEKIEHLTLNIKTSSELNPKILLGVIKLYTIFKKNKPDIIHAQTRVTQVMAAYLANLIKAPYVTTCHGFFKPRWGRKIFGAWGKKVFAISAPVKNHLVEKLNVHEKKIKIIHNGIDISRFSKKYTKEDFINIKNCYGLSDVRGKVIGIISRLSDVKGHKYLISAFAKVLEKNSEAVLLIVGEGNEQRNLLEQVSSLGIKKNVRFIPNVTKTEDLLAIMDIFVLPSLQEGLGLALLEAMAMGKAVIASKVGGISDVVQDGVNGLLSPSKDVKQLTEAILKLIKDKELCLSLGKKAIETVKEKFSMEQMINDMEKVYRECLET